MDDDDDYDLYIVDQPDDVDLYSAALNPFGSLPRHITVTSRNKRAALDVCTSRRGVAVPRPERVQLWPPLFCLIILLRILGVQSFKDVDCEQIVIQSGASKIGMD